MQSPQLVAVLTLALFALTGWVSTTTPDSSTSAMQRTLQDQVDWPSLRLHFKLKRSSMKVFGQTEFSMFASPAVSANGDSVLYDAFASFTQNTNVYNYTLVNGTANSEDSPLPRNNSLGSSANCLESESGRLPPVNVIADAINQAVGVPSGNGEAADCASGGLFKVVVNGVNFTLCAAGSTGFTMTGEDMDVKVEYLASHVDIQAPTVDASTPRCEPTAVSSAVTATGRSLLTRGPRSSATRALRSEFDFTFWSDDSDDSEDSSQHSSAETSGSSDSDHHGCSCKSTPRPCIFIHGMGIDHEEPANIDSFEYYWGDMTPHAPCCSSIQYSVLDTVNNSWVNETQQQKVCDRALAVSNSSAGSVIKDTILVTHSMGNLMLAGGIASGKCSLDSSSTWVGLAGPMKGSMGSDFVQASCAGETNALLEQVADITGKCPPTTALVSLAYQGERFSSTEQDAAYTAAQEAYTANVSALMCSAGYSGLVSKYQAEFWVLGSTVPHKSDDNDGMVEFESCAAGIPASQFGDTWRSKFYRTKLNHYDSEFLYGDGLLSEAKMPVKWFECLL
jgi:hypothetical protein